VVVTFTHQRDDWDDQDDLDERRGTKDERERG